MNEAVIASYTCSVLLMWQVPQAEWLTYISQQKYFKSSSVLLMLEVRCDLRNLRYHISNTVALLFWADVMSYIACFITIALH